MSLLLLPSRHIFLRQTRAFLKDGQPFYVRSMFLLFEEKVYHPNGQSFKLNYIHKVISDIVVVNVFGKKELTAGF